jgi:hypothetical protein
MPKYNTKKPCGKDGWEGREKRRKKGTKEGRYFLADVRWQ